MLEVSGHGDGTLPSIFGPSIEGSIHTARKGASMAHEAYKSVEARTSVKSEVPHQILKNQDILKSSTKLAQHKAVILPHLMKKKG